MVFLERLWLAHPAVILAAFLVPSVYLPGVWPWAALGALGCAVTGFWRRSVTFLGVWCCVIAVLWGVRSAAPPEVHAPIPSAGMVQGWGTVVSEAPVSRSGTARFGFRIDSVQKGDWAFRTSLVVPVSGWKGASPATGSRWRWAGRWTPGNPGAGRLVWGGGAQVGWEAPWWSWRAGFRSWLPKALEPLGPAPAALVLALMIGAVDDLTSAEKDAFRDAGCSHVLALSGMHLSLLAFALTWVLRRRAPAWLVFLVVQIVLALFCFVAGPIPSLLRAWVMAALGGWWLLTKVPIPLTELLAQAFIVCALLWPELTSTLSLQLSFLAMAGLFFWGQRWDRFLRPWVGRWAAVQLASSAAALVATVPLILVLFGEVRWIGLLATPPLVFLTTALLLGGVLFCLLALVPGLDLGLLAPVFQGLYDLTFSCTTWAGRFPALGPAVVVALGVLGGLGVVGRILYTRPKMSALPLTLNYDSPASLQAFLDEHSYNALKRWGQNFLINAGARKQILAALDLQPGEAVWEVGPGLGALTHHLVNDGHPLTVFEIDPGYAEFLRREFGQSPAGFVVVEGDVVKTWKSQPRSGIKTVGNLPYNAASAIIADFVEGGFFPAVFVVTVQLEMAQRMTAVPGNKNYSSFSVLCQSAFRLDDVVTLKPGSFYPAPEVTSRVVRLRPHGLYPGLDHLRFSRFVRECFSSRRKTLRNNLPGAAAALQVSDQDLTAAFAAAGVDLGLRAEALTVDQFVRVFQSLGRQS